MKIKLISLLVNAQLEFERNERFQPGMKNFDGQLIPAGMSARFPLG